MRRFPRTCKAAGAIVLACIFSSCSGAHSVPDIAENRTATFEPGSPNFDMEVVSTVVDGQPGLDVYVSIPHASLVYLRRGERFSAGYEVYVSVSEEHGNGQPAYQTTWSDSVHVASFEGTQAFTPVIFDRRVPLDPGEYVVELMLEDAESGARTSRSQKVEVMQPGGTDVSISDILLLSSRDGGGFEPAVSIHVASGYDSLQAVTQLYNIPKTADVRLALIRFASDTTVATPPHWFTPTYFTLPYMGVDYETRDTVQVSSRMIRDATPEISVEFDLPMLDEGVYVAAVTFADGQGVTERLRYFTVRGPSFPRITSLDEMVASLTYIAKESEMEHIRAAKTPEEVKRRFDAFWADRLPNKQAAANLLASYYERVEQANVLFSNHKEGWKTDRGMIYIVFGAPVYIDNRFNRMDWYYFERGSMVSRLVPPFIFERSRAYGLAGLFENYVLQRSEGYEESWRRKREDWRDGTVL